MKQVVYPSFLKPVLTIEEEEMYESKLSQSFELGLVSQIETVAGELNMKAGESYAADKYDTAKLLKELARDFTKRGKEARLEWERKYKQ